MKYTICKILDVAGLNVFEPIVRLAYGEEPREQIKAIGLFIFVPTLTFAVFLAAWSFVGPRHKTKSGEVPGPTTVVEAWNGIVQFASRENKKAEDFVLADQPRTKALAEVQAEYEKVASYARVSSERFKQLEAKRTEVLNTKLSKYLNAMSATEAEYDANKKERETKLIAKTKAVSNDDVAAKTNYLKLVQQHLAITEQENNHVKAMRSEIDEMRQEKWGVLEAERKRKNALDQAKQFLQKRESFLSSANRSVKVEQQTIAINEQKKNYLAASGPEMFVAGLALVKSTERLRKVASAEYAQPPTFFMQIQTSLACVFMGFLIATAIAIPIGVLCGLSPVFMAAMTPLISLFKPVSPIVWLPIVFIIIGGFDLPEVSGRWAWLFTPSFLASAVTVALCSLWPTLVNTALGVASIDQDHINVARVLRLGFWSRLFKIVIPSALPLIFTGLRISLGVGWMVLIAAELLSSSPGLGKFVWDMFNNGSSETFAQMFVVVFVVGVIGLLLDRIMIVFQRLVSFDGAATAL